METRIRPAGFFPFPYLRAPDSLESLNAVIPGTSGLGTLFFSVLARLIMLLGHGPFYCVLSELPPFPALAVYLSILSGSFPMNF